MSVSAHHAWVALCVLCCVVTATHAACNNQELLDACLQDGGGQSCYSQWNCPPSATNSAGDGAIFLESTDHAGFSFGDIGRSISNAVGNVGGSIVNTVRNLFGGGGGGSPSLTAGVNAPSFFSNMRNSISNTVRNIFGGGGGAGANVGLHPPDDAGPPSPDLRQCICYGGGAACFSKFGGSPPAQCAGQSGWGMYDCLVNLPEYASYQGCRHTPTHPVVADSSASSFDMGASNGLSTSASTGFSPSATTSSEAATGGGLVYCDKVGPAFLTKVKQVCANLQISNCNWLMAAMAFETGGSFAPGQKNMAGSGATGLIQFMPSTATSLGTSTSALAKMTAVQQLDYVQKYFNPYKGELTSLESVYMAILWPAAVGKGPGYVLFSSGREYSQNRGLDINNDHKVTAAEAAAKVREKLQEGLAANPPCLSSGGSSASSTPFTPPVSANGGNNGQGCDQAKLAACVQGGGGRACYPKWNCPMPANGAAATVSPTNTNAGAGSIPARISQATLAMRGASSRSGPGGGNVACAWMVNKVIVKAGLRPIGANTNYVPSVEDALQGGRGQLVSAANAVAGDIVISPGEAHIGICLNKGCSKVLSNSSSRAAFVWESGLNFDGYYGGGSSRIYRVLN